MGMDIGHKLSPDDVSFRVFRGGVVLKGACGEKLHITADDWPTLRKMVNKAMRKARQFDNGEREITAVQKILLDALKANPSGFPSTGLMGRL